MIQDRVLQRSKKLPAQFIDRSHRIKQIRIDLAVFLGDRDDKRKLSRFLNVLYNTFSRCRRLLRLLTDRTGNRNFYVVCTCRKHCCLTYTKASCDRDRPLRLLLNEMLANVLRPRFIFRTDRRRLQRDHALIIMTVEITIGKTATGKQVRETLAVLRIHAVGVPALLQVQVHVFAVNGRHTGHILRLLHASFDLKGHNAGIDQVRKQIDRAQILRTDNVTILLSGEFLLSICVSADTVGQTTRLGTTPAITAATAQHARKQAGSGITIAKCTMDETLDLQAGDRTNGADLFQRHFAGRYHARSTEALHLLRARCPCDPGLRAYMQRKTRKMLPHIAKHTEILNDDAIQSTLIIRAQKRVQLTFKLPLCKQCINGQIYFFAEQMRPIDRFQKLLGVGVLCICAGAETVPADIDGVRSGGKCRFHGVNASRRRQKFCHT